MTPFSSRPRRVLVAHNVKRHGWGGMARMMESIHAELAQAGWEVDYFTADDMPAGKSARLNRYTFPWHLRRRVRQAWLSGRPYGIVNVHEPSGAGCVLARSRLGNPAIVAMSHGVEQRAWEMLLAPTPGLTPPSVKTRILLPLTTLWQARITLRRANHVLCLNYEDKAYLTARFGIPAARITRVVPAAGAEFTEVANRRDYERPCNRILFSGTWLERKGTQAVVEAFTALTRAYPEMQLGIIGAGMPEADVLAAFPEDVRPRVTVPPPMSHTECANVLLDYDIFLLPSFFEGTPLVLLEAFASGMPVITTATCGMKDVVADGNNGLLVTPGASSEIVQAVERLKADPELRNRLGRQALADSAQYTWQNSARTTESVYLGLLGNAESTT